jgi:hypothetical protein
VSISYNQNLEAIHTSGHFDNFGYVFKCTGIRPHNDFCKHLFDFELDNDYILVDKFFNVKAKTRSNASENYLKNIWAIGDCMNTPNKMDKFGFHSIDHAKHLAQNLKKIKCLEQDLIQSDALWYKTWNIIPYDDVGQNRKLEILVNLGSVIVRVLDGSLVGGVEDKKKTNSNVKKSDQDRKLAFIRQKTIDDVSGK